MEPPVTLYDLGNSICEIKHPRRGLYRKLLGVKVDPRTLAPEGCARAGKTTDFP
jgi:hypothetical protein